MDPKVRGERWGEERVEGAVVTNVEPLYLSYRSRDYNVLFVFARTKAVHGPSKTQATF